MTTLLTRYEPALKSYLRIVRRLGDESDDILQAFVADSLLEREMLRHANEGRGKFRTFLLTCLNHFVASWYRTAKAKSTASLGGTLATDEPTPSAQIEAIWARTLIQDVITAMREHCLTEKRNDIWTVFEGRMLAEFFENQPPISYETLAAQLGLRSPTQAANLLVTAKRLYARMLRVAVNEYEHDEANIEAEIADLQNTLAAG